MDANEIVEYQEEILAVIEREKLSNEGERGLVVYLDNDVLKEKVYSINPDGELYLSFWNTGNGFSIKHEEELKNEKSQGFTMKMR